MPFPAIRLLSFMAILVVISWQCFIWFEPGGGNRKATYRLQQRLQAFRAWNEEPNLETRSRWEQELVLKRRHQQLEDSGMLTLFLSVDGLLLYWYWRCWVKKWNA